MKCPNCGEEINRENCVCNRCGTGITTTGSTESSTKAGTSKLAIAAMISGILAFFTFGISLIFTAIFSIYALRAIKKSEGKLKGKYYVYAAKAISLSFILCAVIFVYFWRMDAEPIPNDYTIEDLVSAPEEYDVTYELLMSLKDYNDIIPESVFRYEDMPEEEAGQKLFNILKQVSMDNDSNSEPIDINDFPSFASIARELENILLKGDFTNKRLLGQLVAEDINKLWLQAAPARQIIARLSRYEQIADLSEQNLHDVEHFPPLAEIKHLATLYKSYIIVQVEQGNIDESISELIKFNSIFRKFSVNARSTITKLVCIAVLTSNLDAANYIINHPRVTTEQVRSLSQHFYPLTDSETSLKNPLISEYLMFRNALYEDILRPSKFKTTGPFVKPNSTLRIYRNVFKKILYDSGEIESFHLTPMYPLPIAKLFDDSIVEDIYNCEISLKDKIYNPVGILLIGILTPAYNKIIEVKTRLQIDDDTFQIMLNKRMGKEINLKACAYSENYIIDNEKHRLLSPGPDRKAGTKDDIFREYNPDVINFVPDNTNL